MNYKITDIQIIPIQPRDGLIAFASCVIDESLHISSIAIHSKLDGSGYRLTYPTKKVGNKDFYLFHPIQAELSKAIEKALFESIGKLSF